MRRLCWLQCLARPNPRGSCWVMQWIFPPPRRISREGTPMTVRSGRILRSCWHGRQHTCHRQFIHTYIHTYIHQRTSQPTSTTGTNQCEYTHTYALRIQSNRTKQHKGQPNRTQPSAVRTKPKPSQGTARWGEGRCSHLLDGFGVVRIVKHRNDGAFVGKVKVDIGGGLRA